MPNGGPNVVLLSVDALRADHCSCYGYERETTPNLDRFASDYTFFEHAYSVSSHTREAVPALLSGEPPSVCIGDDYALATDTIATRLVETEYTTAGIHSNPYVSRAYGFDRDFDHFDDDLHLGQHKLLALAQRALDKFRNRHYARAETINERALSWIESTEEPFFLWAHYMDPHGPYCPPKDYQGLFGEEKSSMKRAQKLYKRAAVTDPESITDAERREMVNLYDEEIQYTDDQIGAFLDELDSRGLLEETIIIITADHGDGFGEHGYYGHPRELEEELTKVPLMIGGIGGDIDINVPVSILDIVPTVLDAVSTSSKELPGVSLFDIVDSPKSFAERFVVQSVRGDSKKTEHIRRFSARTATEVCFLERDIESGEILSGHHENSTLFESLRAVSEQWLEGSDHESAVETKIEGEVDRRLGALGYK